MGDRGRQLGQPGVDLVEDLGEEVELENFANHRLGELLGVLTKSPFVADDHLDADNFGKDGRGDNGPVMESELVRVRRVCSHNER